MFNRNKIKQLEKTIRQLQENVAKLQYPLKFKVGDVVDQYEWISHGMSATVSDMPIETHLIIVDFRQEINTLLWDSDINSYCTNNYLLFNDRKKETHWVTEKLLKLK